MKRSYPPFARKVKPDASNPKISDDVLAEVEPESMA